ncbi:PREDICTED: uncharacterized protein LOC109587327 [Amphimedon queenslandica]|uniref:Uncharacterized protein n=1 Tax=Amphimedon queenslandica TaxID=400682 RepID=A0AAN0JQ16_AMPQE|nr:PREDICTED: uncharacterized protein LOC109587327 [Amphimedon queenslandica]|eukprot:XP_019859129.1 PREDICTED: uncharacterized protein LOC109587327 [Amphimedon queenslandica]
MYYQQYNGPLNYELNSSNGLIPLEHNDYPLISVIIKPIPSITETSSTASSAAAITISITDNVMRPNSILTSIEVVHDTTSLHSTATISLLSTTSSFLTNAFYSTSSSNVTTTSMTTISTPDQSTGSLIIAGSISSVFILLVVTILVILIVSVLVCRRKQLGTGYANDDSKRIVDEQKQDEGMNVLSNIPANICYLWCYWWK